MATTHADLDIRQDVVDLAAALVGFPSVSREEAALADAIEAALSACGHLRVRRSGNSIVASTNLARAERVVIAGHIDTVPSSGNSLPLFVAAGEEAPVAGVDGSLVATEERLYGLGSCDMKGGLAVALHLAAEVTAPVRDVTYVFYDCEEIEADFNGLKRIADHHPDWLAADFAVLMEPSNASVEGGCQGTIRVDVTVRGRRAHTARGWMGQNAIHGAGEVLARLAAYQPREVEIDGLRYREGLQAVFIRGGVAGNVVPDECVVTVNHRFAPSRSAAEAEAHLREVFAGFEVSVVDAVDGALPGLSRPAADDFVREVGKLPNPKLGWTDVARFSALGVPAVNFGPADPALAHAPNEFVPVAQIREVAAVMSRWLGAAR